MFGLSYEKIDDAGLHIVISGKKVLLEVDHIVLCAGQEPQRELKDALAEKGVECHLIGGAHTAAELDARRAIEQAFQLALKI